MNVLELWRYPVKSMAGERLFSATVTREGFFGDRVLQVYDAARRVVTSRTRPLLLAHQGVLGSDGEPLVDGRPWRSPEVARDVQEAAGPGAHLARGSWRFDVLPLLVATDGALTAFGHDHRRLRPNLVVGGVRGLAERSWEGFGIRIGAVIIALADLRGRCVMTTFDPDTQEQKTAVLHAIVRDFGGKMCLNASVLAGGRIAVGDRVELIAAEGLQRAIEASVRGDGEDANPWTP